MATIYYRLRSKSENSSIYLKLSISRTQRYERCTGLSINAKDWSINTNLPKQNNPINKKLASSLKGLDKYISDALNNAIIQG